MTKPQINKSDIGAQSAWKGFSSQTLYIARRLLSDNEGYEYYPEDVEDLVVKNNGKIIEAVQVKNLSRDLSLSSLASTKSSKSGEGFFKRMVSMHSIDPLFTKVTVAHFGPLGAELQELQKGIVTTKATLVRKLINNHQLSEKDATWLIDSLSFEKVDINTLHEGIEAQIRNYVPVMAAPALAKDLLVQYISELSNSKGFTTISQWNEKLHDIGVSISAIDGFYKTYNKSLVRLSDLQSVANEDQLRMEFSQGIAANPSHIRYNLDFKRESWLDAIHRGFETSKIVVVKGVSGQGKSTLCYRYLMDNYPEEAVFCVRDLSSSEEVRNLVATLSELGRHNKNLVFYIDVIPGGVLWAYLVQELQARGLNIPVLVSIRNEDYNLTSINGKAIQYEIVELSLSKEEAELIYMGVTNDVPHPYLRSFNDAWDVFGGSGPLIEFTYLLTNNQTLSNRIREQVDALLQTGIKDDWLSLLQMVSYVGRVGASIDVKKAKQLLQCTDIQAAIRRFKDEYLVREIPGDRLEALHPVRAQIIYDTLCQLICSTSREIIFQTIPCLTPENVYYVLLDYFSHTKFDITDIKNMANLEYSEWASYASVVKTMLWLDVKRYVDSNIDFLQAFIKKYGKAWLCFIPLDPTGIDRPGELIAEGMKDILTRHNPNVQCIIDEVKDSLTSLSIDYVATDCFLRECVQPMAVPTTGTEKTSMGYSLFWLHQRQYPVKLSLDPNRIKQCVLEGDVLDSANLIRGLAEHVQFQDSYQVAVECLIERLIPEMKILQFECDKDRVACKFVPPFENEGQLPEGEKNANQYWRIQMLNILKQMYPHKEYIDIELIGVDILDDFGIPALDNKLHISKKHRPNPWTSEVNSWFKSRIDYTLRPESWVEYVQEIDGIRTSVNNLVVAMLKLVDELYKKRRFTKERGERVDELKRVFRIHTFAENYLPMTSVDRFCLFTEGNAWKIASQMQSELFPIRQLLSIEEYKPFRKLLNDVYSSLDNFFSQADEIVIARLRGKSMDEIKNPRLAMYNLYNATKALPLFQNEYDRLFSNYSTLDDAFSQQETENLLTLLNAWRYVLDYPPAGTAIVYDARERVKNEKTYWAQKLKTAVAEVNGVLLESDKQACVVVTYDPCVHATIETAYTDFVLKFRQYFCDAVLPSSARWYLEVQPQEIVYVPILLGQTSPSAFKVPFYRLLDSNIEELAHPMFPTEIAPDVYQQLFPEKNQQIWIASMTSLQLTKLHLKKYSAVIGVPQNEKCILSRNLYKDHLLTSIKQQWDTFCECKSILIGNMDNLNSELSQSAETVLTLMECLDDITEEIVNEVDVTDTIKVIGEVATIMLLLMSSID